MRHGYYVGKPMRIDWFRLLMVFSLLAVSPVRSAPTPKWIWLGPRGRQIADDEVCYLSKTFIVTGKVLKAELSATADNEMTAYVNGAPVATGTDWQFISRTDVTSHLQPGTNVLTFRAQNHGGMAAFLAKLDLTMAGGRHVVIVSDTNWLASAHEQAGWSKGGFRAHDWAHPISFGPLGVEPWGNVMREPSATPADELKVLPGFKVELVHSATKEEGSWISLTIDPRGRLIISPQSMAPPMNRPPLLRVTLGPDGTWQNVERLDLPVWSAMGLLYAFDSLYVNGFGTNGLGLYRLRDTNGDDHFDQVDFLVRFEGNGGEHGPHGVVLGPDKMLYVVNGNFVKLVDGLSPHSPHRNYADDQILPRMEDGNGFGASQKPPGGHILRISPDGKSRELFAAGQRNDYDIAFNADGELFGFDSDMEWDWGTPWHRPIRINHIVNGGEYGYREGSAKWPNGYPDSLPTTLNVGVGSPTGMKFGTGAKFPPEYQRALFAFDWAYGRILAVHLKPRGCTYSGSFENFLVGKGMPVTDLEFGHDGAMYFITGGRGLQSGLYRITYVGPESTAPVDCRNQAGREARVLRHQLEAFHGHQNPQALDFAWPYLNSHDRWIRYAARVAVESQPVAQWQDRALSEQRPDAALTALLALARCGDSEMQMPLLESLDALDLRQFTEAQTLAALRVLEVCLCRMGRPDEETCDEILWRLDSMYPAKSQAINRELCQLLVYFHSPTVIQKSLALLAKAPTLEEQVTYIFDLRQVPSGWTKEQRLTYFSWFKRDHSQAGHSAETLKWFTDAGRSYANGASFPKFMTHIRDEAAVTLTDAERVEFAGDFLHPPPEVPTELMARHKFVKEWTLGDLLPHLDEVSHGRNFQRGRDAFRVVQCYACHRFGDQGGAVGPDITGVGNRFNRHDLIENILDPNKAISDQYQNINVSTTDGDDYSGHVLEENDDKLVLLTSPLTGGSTVVLKKDIVRRKVSIVSAMPEGLLNILDEDEILDLLAYLESGGNPRSSEFRHGKR